MAILDELGKKITSAGQNMVKGTKDLADLARLNSQISDEQRVITELYTKIGEMFYEKLGSGLEKLGTEAPAFQESCGAVSEALKKVEQYQNDILQIKGVVNCKKCGAELENTVSFCSSCGAEIEKPVMPEPAEESKKFCLGCGSELVAEAAFCTSCGQKAEQ